jgi:hypothetical protein
MPPRIALRKADLEILAVVDDLLDGLTEGYHRSSTRRGPPSTSASWLRK